MPMQPPDLESLLTGEMPSELTDKLAEAIQASVQTNTQLVQTIQQNNQAILQAINMLADIMSRQRRLIFDAKGKPIGSELV